MNATMHRFTTALAVAALSFAAAAAAAPQPVPPHQAIAGASPEPITAGAASRQGDLEAFFDGVMAAHLKYKPLAGATVSVVKDGEVIC